MFSSVFRLLEQAPCSYRFLQGGLETLLHCGQGRLNVRASVSSVTGTTDIGFSLKSSVLVTASQKVGAVSPEL